MFVLCKFFWEITDYYWIIKGKTFFIYGIWKKLQLNIRSGSQIEPKFSRGTKMSERTSILKTSGYWFPTGFLVKENLFFHEKCENQSPVSDLGNSTLSL